MHNGIKSIDHPVIAVENMEASRIAYENLGFTVPPRGSHVEWGTGNWCLMFPDDYLELRGILDPERYTLNLDEVLKRFGEGLMGVAFGTDSAQGNYDEMIGNGLVPKGFPKELTRNFELAEGWVQPQFKLCFPQEADIIGLMHVVMCEHLTPELTRKPEYLKHPNGTLGVISMTGIVDDLDKTEIVQRRLLGRKEVKRIDERIEATLASGQKIVFMLKDEFESRYAGLSRSIPGDEGVHLEAMALKVDDIGKISSILQQNNIPFEFRENGAAVVGASYTCGAILEFVEACFCNQHSQFI